MQEKCLWKQKVVAWILTAAMIISLVVIPDVSVQAAGTDFKSIGKTSAKVTATITKEKEDGEYHEYHLTVKNGLSTSISDWIVAVPMTDISSVEDWTSWSGVQSFFTGTYLLISPTNNRNSVIGAGGQFGGTDGSFKFCYMGKSNCSSSKATVYYKEGNSKTGAFDSVLNGANGGGATSGNSGNTTGGTSTTDTTTNKNTGIEYNYAKLLQESLYFYDANMCGGEVSAHTGLSWRGNCHTEDQKVTYKGKTVDVSGGFHDAGDHVKFGITEGYAASVLALSYYEFGEAFNELDQTTHYKTIMDHFCDYFVNCTIYSDNTNKSGSVQAFCYNVGDGSDGTPSSDHGYWGAPEKQSGYNRKNMTLFTSSSKPATDIVCISACALALHAHNFKSDAKASKYLKVAKDLYAYAKKNSKGCYSVTQYDSNSYQDDMAAAAAALYVATGDSSYKKDAEAYNINTGWVLCWNNTDGIVAALLNKNSDVSSIASYGNTTTNQGFKFILQWGSCRYNTAEQFMGLIYDKNAKANKYGSWATGQMKYILGNNKKKQCFVVGYNGNSSKYPHHRAASNSTDAGKVSANHYTLLGALVGGPTDTNDSYNDSQSDYTANEVALDYNATLVGSAAGLYLLHRKDADAHNSLATQEELKAIGVTKYYGSGSTAVDGPQAGTANDSNSVSGSTSGSSAGSVTAASIKGKKVQGVKVKAGKKKLTLTWKKMAGVTGYQIQISKKSNFKKKTTVTVGATKTKKVLKKCSKKKLAKRKKYYVRIRPYVKTNGGTKAYGKWVKKSKKVK